MTVSIERYEVELKLKPVASSPYQKLYGGDIEGDVTVHLVNDGVQPVEQVDLAVYRLLSVCKASEASGEPLEWCQAVETMDDRRQVNAVRVGLADAVAPGGRATVRLCYEGPVCGYPECYPYVRDHISHDFTLLRYDVNWFPTVKSMAIPERPFGYTLTVAAPDSLVVVSEGERTELERRNGTASVRYTSPAHHTARFTVAAAPYRMFSVDSHAEVYLLGDDSPMQAIGRVLSEVNAACSQWLGTPPAELLRIAEIPEGYGSEASEGLILQTEDGFGRGLGRDDALRLALSAFGHEAIHRWHPQPSIRDRTRLMDEGLTHYLEARLLQRSFGPAAFDERMEQYRLGFLSAPPAALSVPISDAASSGHVDTISRGKGPWAFAVLHAWLGDGPFLDILRTYASEFRDRTASWEDFLRVAQSRTKDGIGEWAEDWLRTATSSELLGSATTVRDVAARYAMRKG